MTWTSASPRSSRRSAGAGPPHPRGQGHRGSAPRRRGRRGALRPRDLGGAGRRRPARHRPARPTSGGGGYGIVEQCVVLEQVGRTVAPVPVAGHPPCSAPLPIAAFGTRRAAAALGAARGRRQRRSSPPPWPSRPTAGPSSPTATADRRRRTAGASTASRPACRPAPSPTPSSCPPPTPTAASAIFVVERGAAGPHDRAPAGHQPRHRGPPHARRRGGRRRRSLGGPERGADVLRGCSSGPPSALCAQQLGVARPRRSR